MSVSQSVKRAIIQACAAVAQNPFIQNLWLGTLYKGETKVVCAPGLNCWSCPAAAFGCPIGAMQTLAASSQHALSFYAIGFLVLLGSLFGRMICGFLCVFGFLQDLLFKIPSPKLKVPARADKLLRKLKYIVLVVMVLALPAVVVDGFGFGRPWFCEYLCPAGTIEAGIPLIAANPSLQGLAGAGFFWKLLVAIAIVAASVFVSRPFCKYLCPLGAIYGLFNRFSAVRLSIDNAKCTHCGRCSSVCVMDLEVTECVGSSSECIRCGMCKSVCPVSAIRWTAFETSNGALNTASSREDDC